MLLRSASTPIFRSFTEPDLGLRIKPIRPISMSLSSIKKISSESDLRHNSFSKKKVLSTTPSIRPVLVEEEVEDEIDSCFGTIALFYEERDAIGVEEKAIPGVSDGIGGCDGGGGGLSGGSGGGSGESGMQSESMDSYYQRMINEYPGDALLLGNYARFLKEVKGDTVKAEEYCERAILGKASDGKVLSMYGELIWSNHKDGSRAQYYFDQAVKSAPDDSYVLASYARFLWDAGEDEDEDEDEDRLYVNSIKPFTTPPNHWPPLAAAS
ncbi:hypothetical protein HS088_TW04G00134 [Tripterygium wilfordii]|uniref:Tetratricopeptide repeat-like superfamily protein n=1 Tax=Tripterygium wilfordii TaxID=458696 RepID=A0A7J7DPQ4_TRIWF|nr:uncharacterized protein LOC119996396 [Tripterygium wilfordii]KAF5748184.1 hypothetical protein HS088_TW04G00134 [Tripterygium wilfordii]